MNPHSRRSRVAGKSRTPVGAVSWLNRNPGQPANRDATFAGQQSDGRPGTFGVLRAAINLAAGIAAGRGAIKDHSGLAVFVTQSTWDDPAEQVLSGKFLWGGER